MAKKQKSASAKKPAKPAGKPAAAVKKVSPAKPAPAPKVPVAAVKSTKSDDLKRRILERKTDKPIAFSLDEVREIAKRNEKTATPAGVASGKPANESAKAEPLPTSKP